MEPLIKSNSDTSYIKAIYFNDKEQCFVFDSESTSKIFFRDSVKDKPVAIISVAGAFRKGKSFLLNFFLRYLKYVQKNGFQSDPDWIGPLDQPLHGFPWRGGSERETEGILIWAEPICIKLPDGYEIVVILMDTQGSFDTSSTIKECATIFAISTMISSFEIYNISGNFQEDYLSHLHLFTEYGRIALESSDTKPFQSLLFLIRDWSYPYEYDFGYSPELLEKRLTIKENQANELICVRKHVKECFDNVELFLLPHPGVKVATTPNFNGNAEDIDETFRLYLSKLITSIISPQNLKPKLSQGIPIKCSDIQTYFDSYTKIFQSNTLPEPKTIMQATSEANNLVALNSSKQFYISIMNEFCGSDKPYTSPEILKEKHDLCLSEAIHHFIEIKRFGGDAVTEKYRTQLDTELNLEYDRFFKMNQSKQINSIRFITTAFVVCVFSFLLSQLLDVVGLDPLMLPFDIVCIVLIVLIIFSIYSQFTGNYPYIQYNFNLLTDIILQKIKTLFFHYYFGHQKTQ